MTTKTKPKFKTASIEFPNGGPLSLCCVCGQYILPALPTRRAVSTFWLDVVCDAQTGHVVGAAHDWCAGYAERDSKPLNELAVREFHQLCQDYGENLPLELVDLTTIFEEKEK